VLTPEQVTRLRDYAESGKQWPAVRDHARDLLAVDARRRAAARSPAPVLTRTPARDCVGTVLTLLTIAAIVATALFAPV